MVLNRWAAYLCLHSISYVYKSSSRIKPSQVAAISLLVRLMMFTYIQAVPKYLQCNTIKIDFNTRWSSSGIRVCKKILFDHPHHPIKISLLISNLTYNYYLKPYKVKLEPIFGWHSNSILFIQPCYVRILLITNINKFSISMIATFSANHKKRIS